MDPNAAASMKLDELKRAAASLSEHVEDSHVSSSGMQFSSQVRPYRQLNRDWNIGPVLKGQHFGRCTKDMPDPARPGRIRYFHFTKGWRYRRGTD